jgi:hypothetical protein
LILCPIPVVQREERDVKAECLAKTFETVGAMEGAAGAYREVLVRFRKSSPGAPTLPEFFSDALVVPKIGELGCALPQSRGRSRDWFPGPAVAAMHLNGYFESL